MRYLNILKQNRWLIIILIVATTLRLYKLDFQSLWMDEIYTMNVASSKLSFLQVINEVNEKEGFPYIYFLILNLLFSIFGDLSIIPRVISSFFGVLSVLFIYKLGKKLLNKNVGLYAAFFLTVNEFSIYHSQEARPYHIYIFAVITSYYYLIKFIDKNNLVNFIKYSLSLGVLVNTNFFSYTNVIAQFIILISYLIFVENKSRANYFKKIIYIGIITLIFSLPNVIMVLKILKFKSNWIPFPTNEHLTIILKELFTNYELLIFLATPLFIFYLIKIFNSNEIGINETLKNKNLTSYFILFSWIFLPLVILLTKTYLGSSVLIPRYFSSLLPPIILIFSFSINYIKNNFIRLSYFGVVIFFSLFNILLVKQYYSQPTKSQFREAAQLIIDKNNNQEPVYTSLKYWYDFYLNNKDVTFNVIEKINLDSLIEEIKSNKNLIKPFWYIDAHDRPFKVSEENQIFLDTNFYLENNFDGRDAWSKHYVLLSGNSGKVDVTAFGQLQAQNGNIFKYNLESFSFSQGTIIASGWAFFELQDAIDTKITLVLVNDSKITEMNTSKVIRKDTTIYFENKFNLDNAGFNCIYNINNLPIGSYKLAIYVINKKTNKKGLLITDKLIENKEK